MLIGSRAIQGIGGSSIMSLTNFIVGDVVPLEKRGVSRVAKGGVEGALSFPVAGKEKARKGGVTFHADFWKVLSLFRFGLICSVV